MPPRASRSKRARPIPDGRYLGGSGQKGLEAAGAELERKSDRLSANGQPNVQNELQNGQSDPASGGRPIGLNV
ncbi:hypothetical protein [Bosea sp. BIWAKO-01]|uniref:hypothetical protein n=1 Tax=Bosea sp. BIWAKO-01 TaxID=506668 RepID=UPI000853E9D6|nr:hypothetical protein [Bosea sp. BIWAKO-01]GAU83928.1 hypothetical protein BIWAKO_03857 [Bosea sp. BIWAKO-01]